MYWIPTHLLSSKLYRYSHVLDHIRCLWEPNGKIEEKRHNISRLIIFIVSEYFLRLVLNECICISEFYLHMTRYSHFKISKMLLQFSAWKYHGRRNKPKGTNYTSGFKYRKGSQSLMKSLKSSWKFHILLKGPNSYKDFKISKGLKSSQRFQIFKKINIRIWNLYQDLKRFWDFWDSIWNWLCIWHPFGGFCTP